MATSSDTTVVGTSSADTLTGGAGNDVLSGGGGDDFLSGGAGSDTLDGGSGSDLLNGGSGSDTLIYTLAENSGSTDIYIGGSGIDTVQLNLTSSEWLSNTVQQEVARYVQHLASVKTNINTGEVSNGTASDFTFDFGNGTKLTVSMMEKLDVWVNGAAIDFHAPVISAADSLGGVIEDASTPMLSSSGNISFFDVDLSQTHSVSVQSHSDNSLGGVLTATLTDSAQGDGAGKVTWSYSLADGTDGVAGTVQSMAAGESATETFTIVITDSSGKQVTQDVTITLSGTNDAPVVSGHVSGQGVEDGNSFSINLLADASDIDHGAALHVEGLNSLPDGVSLSGSTLTVDPGNAAFQHLAEGDTQVITLSYQVVDEHGAWADETAEVTVTGVNDAPVVSSAVTGSATEDGASSTLDALANASDVDNTVSALALAVTGLPGTLPAGVSYDAATHSFTLDPGNAAYQHLAQGDTTTVTVNYGVSDGIATTAASVSWTVTGTNDAATITASASEDTSVTEVGSGVAGDPSAGGQLTVHDVDSGEAHFQTPVSLTGTYGDFNFNASTGTWSYALDNNRAATDALATGSVVHDTLTVKSFDGSASYTIDVAVNGSNDSVNHTPTDIVLSMVEPGGNTLPGAGAVLGTLSTIDVDSSDTFTYSLISSSTLSGSAASFSISGNSLSTGTGLASNSVYQLDIQTTDSSSATYHETFNIITGTNAQGQVTGDDGSLPSGGGTSSILIGDDVLYGSGGNDVIFGGSGNDTLFGQNGNDVLYGGAGNDTLSGGNQADRFVFLASDNGGTDTITNFTATGANADTLDISDLLVNYNPATPSAFIHFTESGGNTIVSVDRDGSGGSYGFQDVAILNGVTGLNMNDMLTSGKLDVLP